MYLGIHSLKDIVELLSWLIGAISLAVAARAYIVGKSQFNFAVIIGCTKRFQGIMSKLRSANGQKRLVLLRQYIDLCNEELFYFKNKYIPEEVIDEWIEGMICYLPVYVKSEETYINSILAPEIVEQNLLRDYPRIENSFRVYRKYDLSREEDREELVKEIKYNLRHNVR